MCELIALASLIAEGGLQGAQASEAVAYGIFPDQGAGQCPLCWAGRSLTTGPPGKPLFDFNEREFKQPHVVSGYRISGNSEWIQEGSW